MSVSPVSAMDVRDDFADMTPWRVSASDGVSASIHPADGPEGKALRLDFDLGGSAGYAMARRALPVELPENYEISFFVRGDAPDNNLEFKFIDASGDSVWWFRRRNFQFPKGWRQVRIKKRQIEFAWGPTADRVLHRAASVEFVVSAGKGGGRGAVSFAGLSIRELPPESAPFPAIQASASSDSPGSESFRAVDGDASTAWKSAPSQGAVQTLTLDFGRPREFGGLTLSWLPGLHASRYDVEFSDDGKQWRTIRRVAGADGGRHSLMLSDAETRYLRLRLLEGPSSAYGLSELRLREPAFGATPNAFFQALAKESPRGHYPRGMSGEQSFWTLVGVDGGHDSGLLSEDGALEAGKGGFSIEPFVAQGSRVVTWADVEISQSLPDGFLPMPAVTWRHPQWELRTSVFAAGLPDAVRLFARYTLTNRTGERLPLRLALAARPFQVNAPSQFLGIEGGVSPVRDLDWDGRVLTVNGRCSLRPLDAPDKVGVFSSDSSGIVEQIAASVGFSTRSLHDEAGYASAALSYPFILPPHGDASVVLVLSPAGEPRGGGPDSREEFDRLEKATADSWREKLSRVALSVPPVGQPLADSLRTTLAHILMSRNGVVLQPGTRSYDRSWIRDGAMMAQALLRMGVPVQEIASYAHWFAGRQFPDGKVPCCADTRGSDPVAENDSQGEFIFLVRLLNDYGGGTKDLQTLWPHAEAAARYMETLRQSERSEKNRTPETISNWGLMPASISHEGYSAKPMHSYWDDFWSLRGYKDIVVIAKVLGRKGDASYWEGRRDEFRRDLYASLASMKARGVPYIPGAAELGDFDATSTTIALAPGGEQANLPQAQLIETFEKYWRNFIDRRDGRKNDWIDYTPYEWRVVGTFVRLGWRERIPGLLDFFMADRRPLAWNQWPEVITRESRKPRFLGDLPHAWVESDFVRSALDMFAYERDEDGALVLAAGVPRAWMEGKGVAVAGLRTPYGGLGYSLRKEERRLVLEISKDAGLPPGGFVFPWPGPGEPGRTLVDGKEARWRDGELRLATPARVEVEAL